MNKPTGFDNAIDEGRERVRTPVPSSTFVGGGVSRGGEAPKGGVMPTAKAKVKEIVSRTFSFVARVSPQVMINGNISRVSYALQNQGANPVYWAEGVAPSLVGGNVYGGMLLQPGESYFCEFFCSTNDIYVLSLGGDVQLSVIERTEVVRGF